jgi:hypothetical protein
MSFPRQINNPTPQSGAPAIVNENGKTQRAHALFARNYLTSTGLTLGYYGGHLNGTLIADGTIALDASQANVYVVAHRTTGVVSKATTTTNWDDTATYGRLFRAETSASAIVNDDDDDFDWRAQEGGIFDHGAAAGFGDVVGPASATDNDLARFDTASGKLLKAGFSYDTDATLAANSNVRVATQAAIKAYVDALLAGLSWKQAVRAATTAAVTLATDLENGDSIDGVTLATGNRILVKNQAAPAENGIYVVAASGAPTRATDADSGAELVNASVYVSEGTTLADTQWTCTTNATITVGSTSLAFAQLSSGGGGVATDSIWDAAGDLAVGTGANTAAKLTMGSALQVLRVNAAGTALEWAAAAAGGSSMIISNPSGNFNRPGDTNVYQAADLVANSTTAGSVTPVAITVAGTAGAQVRLLRARLQKSGTTGTNAQFHVHVWRTAPTVANGDNGGFSPNNAANYLGRFTIGGMTALSDGCVGYGVPGIGLEVPIDLAGGVTQVHCLIEALAAYVPANAETFTITLDVEELT